MKLNNKKGISLIVLVITIIVMIILAAAIILALNGNNILVKANEAKTASNMANLKEAATLAYSEYDLAKKTGTTIDKTAEEYVKEKLTNNFTQEQLNSLKVTEEGKILVGSGIYAENKGIKLGEYVDYVITEPVTSTTYKVYDSTTQAESTSVYFAAQTGENALKWRYMGIDDNGNALLIADRPLDSTMNLWGAEDYLQAVDKLNGVCKELYSTNKGIARSINREDVFKVLGIVNPRMQFTDADLKYVYIYNEMTIGDIIETYGMPAITNKTTPDGSDINSCVVNNYNFTVKDYVDDTTDEYKLICENSLGKKISYSLASMQTDVMFYPSHNHASYGLGEVYSGGMGKHTIYASRSLTTSHSHNIRPVIVLNQDVKIGTKTNDVWNLQ